MTTTDSKPYARCNTCGVDLDTKEVAREHGMATMAPTGEAGVIARGHSYRVVNPTPQEITENRVRGVVDRAVSDALDEAFEDLDRAIRRGDVTEEQVTDALRGYSDFMDGWDEWRAGEDR